LFDIGDNIPDVFQARGNADETRCNANDGTFFVR
jgi:hypothetical protein